MSEGETLAIGGSLDGTRIRSVGNCIRVPKRRGSVFDYGALSPDVPVAIEYEIYEIRVIRAHGERWRFFVETSLPEATATARALALIYQIECEGATA